MKTTHFVWLSIIELIQQDSATKDYAADFLNQADSIDDTCYVYYNDDDQSAIYALNDQQREQLVDHINTSEGSSSGPNADQNQQIIGLMADVFWAELNEKYRMTS